MFCGGKPNSSANQINKIIPISILVEFYDKKWTLTLTDICVIITTTQGRIPLRHLVYRVHALPESMRSLVWDFGQLNPNVEELYTRQIVRRYVSRAFNSDMQSKTVNARYTRLTLLRRMITIVLV